MHIVFHVPQSIDLAVAGVAGADIFASGVSAGASVSLKLFAGVLGLAFGAAGLDFPFTLASKAAAAVISGAT